MLAVISAQEVKVGTLLGELALGVVLGVVVPWVAIQLERSRFFSATLIYEPLNAFAIGLLVFALASLTHANEFLAAFSAGVMVATLSPEIREAFHKFGEILAELLKLAALLVFGALISPGFLTEINPSGYVFALLALMVIRPIALGLALLGSDLDWRERVVAAWFGPKGFASVVYGILILKAGIARGGDLFHLLAIVIAGSIIAHSSTDVMVARWFQKAEPEPAKLRSSRRS
jgi:NhaP-type Na+/H+ and K+/H+ antiporter